MKLLLCSEGFYTEEIVKKCEDLVGKSRNSINIAVINEAYAAEHKSNLRWVVANLNDVTSSFGGDLELVNLLALDIKEVERRIMKHDVIFVVGGHVDYLMSIFKKTGFAKLLPKLLKTKVYVGSSAGSMIIGKRLSQEAYHEMYAQKGDYGVDKYMEFADFSIIPHLDSPKYNDRKEILLKASRKHKGVIYGLNDDCAIVLEDKKVYTIGSKPLTLNDN
mgnify:CR=1 FL=1